MTDFDSEGLTEQQCKSKQVLQEISSIQRRKVMNKNLTPQEQLSKDKLQEFIKDHPILKQQEKFKRMEEVLEYIKEYWSEDEELTTAIEEALREDL